MFREIHACVRDAENQLREWQNIPHVGEGWVAEAELCNAIKAAFPETLVIQHGRPAWLGRQHVDIWLPRWKVAVEYHGRQHFESIEFFGGKEGLRKTQERDHRKKELCQAQGVALFIATHATAPGEIIEQIRTHHASKQE
jgi:hypothetical protein